MIETFPSGKYPTYMSSKDIDIMERGAFGSVPLSGFTVLAPLDIGPDNSCTWYKQSYAFPNTGEIEETFSGVGDVQMKRILSMSVCIALALCTLFMPEYTAGALRINYEFESILAHPERVRGLALMASGYAKVYEDGFALYYSKTDCLYDTRENAIYVKEREGYSIDDYMKENGVLQEDGSYKIEYRSYIVKILDEESFEGYAIVAEHIGYRRDISGYTFEESNKIPYDFENMDDNETPVYVSMYRLFGDPWTYDGKMVQVDAEYGGETMVYSNWEQRHRVLFGDDRKLD